jgi:hypothetical protein
MKIFYSLAFTSMCIFSMAQVDLTSNLKVCMPFTGNANDLSGNSNNGTVVSATLTTDRFGNANSAYRFDRNDDSHIAIGSFLAIAPTNELTISMWAQSDVTTSNCLFTLFVDNQSDRCVGCAQYSNGGSTMMLWDYGDILSGGRISVQNIPIDIVNWHHYVYVISQSGNIKKMYLDGVQNAGSTYGTQSCTNKSLPFYIGGSYSNGSGGKIMWTGKIDDVSMYNRALTATEVSALYVATSICTSTHTGISELEAAQNLMVYPSVSESGLFTVASNNLDENSLVNVYTMEGRLIKTFTGTTRFSQQIDLTQAAPGLYLLKLTTSKGTYSQKIIRQ